MGVILGWLGGNEETVKAINDAVGKEIASVEVVGEDEDTLILRFTDRTELHLHDAGQSCCEHRYMRTDDDLHAFVGATFVGAAIRDAPDLEDQYGVHEVEFLVVNTSLGAFTVANHNEHNGYYGGFWIVATAQATP